MLQSIQFNDNYSIQADYGLALGKSTKQITVETFFDCSTVEVKTLNKGFLFFFFFYFFHGLEFLFVSMLLIINLGLMQCSIIFMLFSLKNYLLFSRRSNRHSDR